MTSHKAHFKSESLTPFPLSLFHSTTFSFVSLFPISFPSSFFLWTSLLYSRSLSLFLCTLDTSSSLLLLQFLSLLLMNMTSVLCLISMMSTMKQNCLSILFVWPRADGQGGHSGFAGGTPGCPKTTLARLKTDVCHLLSHTSAQQYAPTNVHAHKSSEETKTLRENNFLSAG